MKAIVKPIRKFERRSLEQATGTNFITHGSRRYKEIQGRVFPVYRFGRNLWPRYRICLHWAE